MLPSVTAAAAADPAVVRLRRPLLLLHSLHHYFVPIKRHPFFHFSPPTSVSDHVIIFTAPNRSLNHCLKPQPPLLAHRRQISPAVAARAVAVAFLALPLFRPFATFPTRIGFRKIPPLYFFRPTTALLVLKPYFRVALAALHGFLACVAISTGRLSRGVFLQGTVEWSGMQSSLDRLPVLRLPFSPPRTVLAKFGT